ncbi:hypothetical protein [Halomonas lysinitropha]|uniref:Uncharacterized protein n=1 Tax=Halomonas lysinitropha TaxID=2607506 RepID=A0A5K1I980_9GAMM|nr:hypothetical protein [Halomonas lysinitropha]VVZ97121.1 hypothetical protein HALO32_03237 [Halomonas lysinitropha]
MNTPMANTRIEPPRMKISQPPGVITSIEEVLAQVNDHEHHEFHRYRWLSLRFLTFQTGISRLMEALSVESQQRVQALVEVSASLPMRDPVLRDPAKLAWQPPALQRPHSLQRAHFFILDGDEAARELSRAVLEEWRSRRFYERLQACNGIPALNHLLNACIGQAQAQLQILQEAEDRLPPPPSPPGEVIC